MSKKTLFLFLPIFLVFFVWGIQVGEDFPRIKNRGMFDQYNLQRVIEVQPNGQKTLLLVLISQLDNENPDLYGIWQLTYFPTEPYTTLLPIYPSYSKDFDNIDESIDRSFKLRTADDFPFLDNDFLNKLDQLNIWSSGYVLIDLNGLAEAIMLSDGVEYLSMDAIDSNTIGQITQFLADPNSSLTYQTLLLQHLCGHFTKLDSFTDLNEMKALFPDHLSSSIHPDVLLKDWREFVKSKNGSFCIFPNTELASDINK